MKEIELVYHTDGSRTLNARVEAHEGAASGSRRPITWHERLSSSRFQKGNDRVGDPCWRGNGMGHDGWLRLYPSGN